MKTLRHPALRTPYSAFGTLRHYTLFIFYYTLAICAFSAQSVKNYTQVPIGIEHVMITVDPENWHLTHVSANYRVARDYVPPVIETVKGSDRRLDSRVAPHYNKMYDAAKADGVNLVALIGYRTAEWQENYFNNKVARHMKEDGMTEPQAILRTTKGSAYPGASEHNLGLCMDFTPARRSFDETDQFVWLMANAADYGFILRFPKGKGAITGTNYEPWHWRYVGVEAAKIIKAKGICFEEYLGKRFLSPEDAKKLKAKGVNVGEFLKNQGKPKERDAAKTDAAKNTDATPAENRAPAENFLEKYPLEHIVVTIDQKKWHLAYVRANYRVAPDYAPPALSTVKGSKARLDSRVTPHYNKMYDAARADGVTLIAVSGYRSMQHQENLFNTRVRQRMKEGMTEEEAVRHTAARVAYPGASEHNLGISMDFSSGKVKGGFDKTDQFEWLMLNAADYGFVLRNMPDKTEITGTVYEPWHWRYVGVEDARKIKALGVCLEEYLDMPARLTPEEIEKLKAKGVNIEEHLRAQGARSEIKN